MALAVDGSKTCSTCRVTYTPPENAFCRNRVTKDGFQNICKGCHAKLHRNYKYGLEFGQIDRMKAEQNECCAICAKPSADLVLDHDHKTDVIRQLLCRHCNSLLGMCDDDVSVLKLAIEYLAKHTASH